MKINTDKHLFQWINIHVNRTWYSSNLLEFSEYLTRNWFIQEQCKLKFTRKNFLRRFINFFRSITHSISSDQYHQVWFECSIQFRSHRWGTLTHTWTYIQSPVIRITFLLIRINEFYTELLINNTKKSSRPWELDY